jgi:hypothetical protein
MSFDYARDACTLSVQYPVQRPKPARGSVSVISKAVPTHMKVGTGTRLLLARARRPTISHPRGAETWGKSLSTRSSAVIGTLCSGIMCEYEKAEGRAKLDYQLNTSVPCICDAMRVNAHP